MEEFQSDFFKNRPQRLCHMCGKCCRCSTTAASYDELLEMAQAGDFGASEFLRVFVPYSSYQEAAESAPDTVKNIVSGLKEDGRFDENKINFYKCKYILDNNMCSIYETRPELCKRFPSSPWAVVPPGCGFEGWLFMQREEKKQKVRKYKEEIISLELELKEERDSQRVEKLESYIQKIKDIIGYYAKYGSEDW